jgi:hypothetical protein
LENPLKSAGFFAYGIIGANMFRPRVHPHGYSYKKSGKSAAFF